MDRARISIGTEPVLNGQEFDYFVTGEAGGEVTMPDYYPEIRRVVSVSAKALPDSKFLSDGVLEFGGTVAFCVLYVGDDNTLSCVNYAGEYSSSQNLPSSVAGNLLWVETTAENPQCRVLAPRRISLKARLRSRIFADGQKDCECKVTGADSKEAGAAGKSTLEVLTKNVSAVSRYRAFATAGVSGEMKEKGAVEPVSCDGEVIVTSVEAGRDSVFVKGNINVRAIVLGGDGLYSTAEASLPFEEEISADGAVPEDTAAAWGRVASVNVSSGEDGVLRADAEFDLDVQWCRSTDVTLTEDVYSTDYETKLTVRETDVLGMLCCTTGSLSVSCEGKKADAKDNEYLIGTSAHPVIEKAECRDSKLILSGNCTFKNYIAAGGDVTVEEITAPVKYEVKVAADCPAGEIVWRAAASPFDIHARLDKDRITANCEISIFAEAVRKYKICPVKEVSLSKPRSVAEGAHIKVCYPKGGERVWDIAKRYGATLSELERVNSVSAKDVCDGSPLIVKR